MTGSTAASDLVDVGSWADALVMASIRNTCRSFMTNDTSYIGPIRQLRWWWSIRHDPSIRPFLLRIYESGVDVGYGIVAVRGGKKWVTGGILPTYRGLGLGRVLFEDLTKYASRYGSDVWLEVLESNLRAQHLYAAIGYEDAGWAREGVKLMRFSPHR